MRSSLLHRARYRGDVELMARIRADPGLARAMERTEVLRKRSVMRLQLLGQAVRVKVQMMPNLAQSFDRVAAVIGDDQPLEAYVFADSSINAFVFEAEHSRIIGVSSTAVDQLSAEELEFVIGHELGHVAYGHLAILVEGLLQVATDATIEQAMLLRAWQRASEISADRAGLLCCGSLEVAASALFKTVCGLGLRGVSVDPAEFAGQWEHLAREVLDVGCREQWRLSHPFPPMRMKALCGFFDNPDKDDADDRVERLLAYMDPKSSTAEQPHDPLLARFMYWGGMYLALTDGGPNTHEQAYLQRFAPLAGHADGSGRGLRAEDCLQRFREAQKTRKVRLSARELHQIASALVDAAGVGGRTPAERLSDLHTLGREIGLAPQAIDLFIEKHRQQRQGQRS